jgi:hypothetical protein
MKKNIQFLIFSLSLILSLSPMASASYAVESPDQSRIILEQSESQIEEDEERRRQIKENGYYPTYSVNAANLMKLKNKKAIALTEKGSDPYFKNLRLSPSEFRISFPFNGISSVDDEHLLGFVPSGSFDDGYWTGVTAYFVDDNLGTCRLVVFDLHSGYITDYTDEEPTTGSAEGSDDSGFIYDVLWRGERYMKMLGCANNKPFDKQVLQDLVIYAKKIDNDLPDEP